MKRLFADKLKISPVFFLIICLIWTMMLAGCLFSHPVSLAPNEDFHGTLQAKVSGPIFVGDRLPLILTIEAKNKVTYQLPDLSSHEIPGLEFQKVSSPKPEVFPNGSRQIVHYTLTGWQSGKYIVPAQTINYESPTGVKGTYTIPELPLEIHSILPSNKSETDLLGLDIKPIKNPVGLSPNYKLLQLYLIGILAFLIISMVLRWLYLKYIRKSGEIDAIIPPEPAHIIAFRRLTTVRENQFLSKREFNAYYSELSECVREYIENRYQIRALEMTTEEFLNHLIHIPLLETKYQQVLQDFLNQSDLVKFAKQSPAIEEAERAIIMIEEIIEVTKVTEENIA